MKNPSSNSNLPDMIDLNELVVPEDQMPISNHSYTKPLLVCILSTVAVIAFMSFLGLSLEYKILSTTVIVIAFFLYCTFKLQPSQEEAKSLLECVENAIDVTCKFDIREHQFHYAAKTIYYNFNIEIEELQYTTKVVASHLTFAARQELESHLEGDDVYIDPISNEVILSNVTVISNPQSSERNPLVLIIWRGHLFWCKADENFSLEALQYKNPQ